MKRYLSILFCTIMLLTFSSTQAFCAAADDVIGTWDVQVKSKFKIKKEFTDRGKELGTCTFMDDGALLFEAVVEGVGIDRFYGGTFAVSRNKLQFFLDDDSVSEFDQLLIDWLLLVAGREGIDIVEESIDFDFEKDDIKITKPRIRRNGKPRNTKISIKGNASAMVDGNLSKRKFLLQVIMKFKNKNP